jgi:hypothetical protein
MQSAISETTREARPWWSWLVPSLGQWLWLILLLVLLAQPWRTAMVAADGDACMHWRVGEWMLQTGKIIRADVFSHTRFGQPIISKEWLAEIPFGLAGRVGGLYGLGVVAALLIATTFALLHRQLLREGNDIVMATIVTLLAAWAASTHWLARPHVLSFLMALLWNDTLRRYERNRRTLALAATLSLLTLFWVNLHGAFLAGFTILGAYWLGAIIERDYRKVEVLSGVALLCAVTSLCNPNGYKLHLHNLRFLHSSFLTGWLAEYSSSNFHSVSSIGFLIWLALLFFMFVLKRPRISPSAAILLLSWGYFALYAARNISLFAILTAPIVATSLSENVRGKWREISARVRQMHDASCGWPVVAAVAVVAIAFVPRPTEMPPKDWPVGAVTFIKTHDQQFSGNMFNQYAWGGYLMQYLPDHKVFVDGRADFYGEELLREFSDTTALRTNWTQVLQKYDVSWTLMPTDHRLNLALAMLPSWHCAYSDEVATVFCKVE